MQFDVKLPIFRVWQFPKVRHLQQTGEVGNKTVVWVISVPKIIAVGNSCSSYRQRWTGMVFMRHSLTVQVFASVAYNVNKPGLCERILLRPNNVEQNDFSPLNTETTDCQWQQSINQTNRTLLVPFKQKFPQAPVDCVEPGITLSQPHNWNTIQINEKINILRCAA